MSSWTHPLCALCWHELEPERTPHAFRPEAALRETCCRCGRQTMAGIYYRAAPTEFTHCRAH